jgi:S-adenosylhomocysteine hydrolase
MDALGIGTFETFSSIKSNLPTDIFGVDPIETAYALNDGFLTKKFSDASFNAQEMMTTLSNKEWVSR